MKHKRVLGLLILLEMIVLFSFSGCQSGNSDIMTEAFSYKATDVSGSFGSPISYADGFASSLAVIDPDHPNVGDGMLVSAQCAILVNLAEDKILYAKSPFVRMNPASITKIMTALIALESGDREANRQVGNEINFEQENISLCGYRIGDEISFDITLHGALMASGNDAAAYLSTFVTEDMSEFIELMNARAVKIGATKTNFVNCHGITENGHYSTAYDLYLLFNEASANSELISVLNEATYSSSFIRTTIYNTYRIEADYTSTNQFLTGQRDYPSGVTIIGGKSGSTQDYLYNYGLYFEINQERYVAIVLGESSRDFLYEDLYTLMETALSEAGLDNLPEDRG